LSIGQEILAAVQHLEDPVNHWRLKIREIYI
jgi:hypothetical protein